MVFVGVLGTALVELVATVALAWWGARVGRIHGGAWRHLVWLPIAGFALAVTGSLVAVVQLAGAFDAVADADPSQKAVLLAQGISRAMNALAVFLALSGLATLASLVGCAVGTLRAPPTAG